MIHVVPILPLPSPPCLPPSPPLSLLSLFLGYLVLIWSLVSRLRYTLSGQEGRGGGRGEECERRGWSREALRRNRTRMGRGRVRKRADMRLSEGKKGRKHGRMGEIYGEGEAKREMKEAKKMTPAYERKGRKRL